MAHRPKQGSDELSQRILDYCQVLNLPLDRNELDHVLRRAEQEHASHLELVERLLSVPANDGASGAWNYGFKRRSFVTRSPWRRSTGSSTLNSSTACRWKSWPPVNSSAGATIWYSWVKAAWARLAQRNTPLVTQECEGQVTVTDPCHPLYGRTLTLSGIAVLPGRVRHCQVEILPGQIAYVPVACTNLSTEPRPQTTVLTAATVEELVAAFQAVCGRRHNYATRPKPACLDAPGPRRTNRRHRGDRQGPHGGGGK